MTYRDAAAPERTSNVLIFRPMKGRRWVLGPGLWFMAFWLFAPAVLWAAPSLVTGEGLWKLAIALPVLALFPVVIGRIQEVETLIVSSTHLRRMGFVRTASIAWADVTGSERVDRVVTNSRGGSRRVVLTRVLGREGTSLLIAELQVEDHRDVVRWAVAEAAAGRAGAIDERLRQEGQPARSKWVWLAPHAIVALVITGALGWYGVQDTARREAQRAIRALDDLPSAERRARALAIANGNDDERVRCPALSQAVYGALRMGDTADALRTCERMDTACVAIPYEGERARHPDDRCWGMRALDEARDAHARGDMTAAYDAIERAGNLTMPIYYAVGIEAARGVGATERIGELAERCLRAYGTSDDPEVLEYVGVCRRAANAP